MKFFPIMAILAAYAIITGCQTTRPLVSHCEMGYTEGAKSFARKWISDRHGEGMLGYINIEDPYVKRDGKYTTFSFSPQPAADGSYIFFENTIAFNWITCEQKVVSVTEFIMN